MKLGVKALTMALALAAPAVGGEGAKTTGVFQPGEELTYKVKWNFVRLGTIILQTVQDSSCSDRNDFKIVMIVQSNPDLPFIWIREYNESLINALSLSSRRFKARHRNGEDYYAVTQVHDGSLRTVAYTRTDLNSGALLRTDTLQNVSDYVEGPSLLFYARCIAGGRGKWSVPTIVDGAHV